MKYTVLGNTQITVSVVVEANSREEAIEKASREFTGISEFVGNGGFDKLIGVYRQNESITADEPVVFDDCLEG